MRNIFTEIKYFFLSLKEKILLTRLKGTAKHTYTTKTSKRIYTKGADLTLQSRTEQLIEQVKEGVTSIVKMTDCDPNELLNYIEAAKTPVFFIKNARKSLKIVKEKDGFICETRGFKALFLSYITEKKIAFKTQEMFVLDIDNIDKTHLLYHFYRWYSMKAGLPGFEYETQEKFKASFSNKNRTEMKKMSMEDILSIKDAVARDQEAADFALQYTKYTEGSKKVLEKMKTDDGANI